MAASNTSGENPCIRSLPYGPLAASTSRRTWPDQRELLGDVPAEENSSTSSVTKLRASTNASASCAIAVTVFGTTPPDLPAGAVEQDHLAPGGDPVDELRIPVIEVAAEVLENEQRRSAALGVAKRRYA